MIEAVLAAAARAPEASGWEPIRAALVDGPTVARAAIGGARADRVGHAFALGYALALEALTGDATASALCVTEAGGNHPRAIQTVLADGRVTGEKAWATLADRARTLLVVARAGTSDDGRPILRVVRVATDAPGVAIAPSTAAFVPEIAHARVTLTAAPGDVLPGDGYADYVKPFRTVEDVHVNAALLGYLIGVARRRGLARELVERVAAMLAALVQLGSLDPRAPATHVGLAGALALATAAIADLERAWADAIAIGGDPDGEHARWLRDRALLAVAGKARAERRLRAWDALAWP